VTRKVFESFEFPPVRFAHREDSRAFRRQFPHHESSPRRPCRTSNLHYPKIQRTPPQSSPSNFPPSTPPFLPPLSSLETLLTVWVDITLPTPPFFKHLCNSLQSLPPPPTTSAPNNRSPRLVRRRSGDKHPLQHSRTPDNASQTPRPQLSRAE